ncbi:MAG TPA: M23 family metallopeptidase [Gemmatimonadales bacterium]|nr:M23 family metallopeptidase [Gemmatimonadales bacterium]
MRRRRVVWAALVLAGAGAAWAALGGWPSRQPVRAPAIQVAAAYREFADTLGRRETLSDVLARAGLTGSSYASFLAAAGRLDARRLRPGLVFHFRRPLTDSSVDRLMVRLGPERRLWYARTDSGWSEREEAIPWSPERLRVVGRITSSLYAALDSAIPDSFLPAGERQALAWAIADVYDWEVDFTRDVRAGDRFEVLFDRLVSPEGERRFGRVEAARVDVSGTPTYAYYFVANDDESSAGYYDDQGRSLKRSFLRAPLQFRRISSRFGGRKHPILHTYRRHQGVDYAADYGTPVRATADGVVTHAARDGGYGNMIELRHANGIRTRYGHLSSFVRGLHAGQRVGQGETIGYVGSTGLSTGPHLHYEFLINGRQTNPQRTAAGAGAPVPAGLRAAFDSVRTRLARQLEPTQRTPATSVD